MKRKRTSDSEDDNELSSSEDEQPPKKKKSKKLEPKKETKMSFFGGRQAVSDDEKVEKKAKNKKKKLKIKERLAPILIHEGHEVVIPKSVHGTDEPYNEAIKKYFADFNPADSEIQRKECIYKGYVLVAHTRKGKDFYRVIKAIKNSNRISTIVFDKNGMISSNLDISKVVVTQTETLSSIFEDGDFYYCGDEKLPMTFDMKSLAAKIEPISKKDSEGTLTLLVAGDDKNCLHIHIKFDDKRHIQFTEPQVGDEDDKENSLQINQLVEQSKRNPAYMCTMPTAFLEENLKILKPCVDVEDSILIDIPRGGIVKFTVAGQSITIQNSILKSRAKKKKSEESSDDDEEDKKIEIIPYADDAKYHMAFSDKFSFKLLWGIVNALKVKQYPIMLKMVKISHSVSHLIIEQELSEDSKITQRFPCKTNHAQEASMD